MTRHNNILLIHTENKNVHMYKKSESIVVHYVHWGKLIASLRGENHYRVHLMFSQQVYPQTKIQITECVDILLNEILLL